MPEELRPFWTYGAVALGPALTGFAEWAQQRAAQAGVSKAFCLMREGELLSDLVTAAGGYLGTGGQRRAALALAPGLRPRVDLRGPPRRAAGRCCRGAARRRVRELCATLGVSADASPQLRANADARLNEGRRSPTT